MFELDWLELAVVLGVSMTTSGLALRFWVPKRDASDPVSPAAEAVSLTLVDDTIVSATPSAQAMLDGQATRTGWDSIVALFQSRFPDLPVRPDDLKIGAYVEIDATDSPNDPARLMLTRSSTDLSVELCDDRAAGAVRHQVFLNDRRLDLAGNPADDAPCPIWITDTAGEVTWHNKAYHAVAKSVLGVRAGYARLFDPGELGFDASSNVVRYALQSKDHTPIRWYDITRVQHANETQYFAIEVTAVVQAEAAQRNFVQTLTKTFAHLSIGLAIFDRNRQLALFNPALVDLTELPPEFLSQRPNLLTFFDRLRENQVMPEPKNYSGWRQTLADVVIAATDGRYSETWNLPSGLTYRVTGRPHPDGAIAFLFEDISAEISLTRRFREELEVGHSVIDTLDYAVAVFSPSGRLTFSNSAYEALWDVSYDTTVGADTSVLSSSQMWQAQCQPSPIWADIRDFVASFGQREAFSAQIRRNDGRVIVCTVQPLSGGATLISFDPGEALALPEPAYISA